MSKADYPQDVEQSVVLALKPEPILRLIGVIRSIKPGRRDFALSDEEWESMGLKDTADGEWGAELAPRGVPARRRARSLHNVAAPRAGARRLGD